MDKFSKETRSKIMQAIKGKHTKPELLLRKELSKLGYRYRLHHGKEKIDIAFPSKKIAIFVDGCFWHCCPKHGRNPTSNKTYWLPKLKRNMERDKSTIKLLRKQGWKVIRIWEHDLADAILIDKKMKRILKFI